MTEPVVALSELELSIECDHEECLSTAVVAVKGCSDLEAWLICRRHFNNLSDRVSYLIADGPVVCEGCHRPVMFMCTHYDVTWFLGE